MIPTQIAANVVREDTPAVEAYFIVTTSQHHRIALVCDENDVLVGVIESREVDPGAVDVRSRVCGDICRRDFRSLSADQGDTLYTRGRDIFSETAIETLPVLDARGIPTSLFSRFQAFFRQSYLQVDHAHYAVGLLDAAQLARSRGYDRISAVEFGVAGGRGLVALEVYAREAGRLFGVSIDVYGFDSGEGLPAAVDYRDCTQRWIGGDYRMDVDTLRARLRDAQLVLGDIRDTTKTFFAEFDPAPIAFISVDVDLYSPTVAILDMLRADDERFTPIVTMYFDDVFGELEFQGESLAIREFNESSETVKISPEGIAGVNMMPALLNRFHEYPFKWNAQLKWCNRFAHPRFASPRVAAESLGI